MTQSTMFERVGTARPLARSSDKVPCHEAGERAVASGMVASHCKRICSVLQSSSVPMTAHEIGAQCGLDNVEVSRRMAAIVKDDPKKGKPPVAECARRRCSITGRRITAYVALRD